MFLFNLLKREDRRLRTLTYIIGGGLFVLLAGLWVVQIVRASRFEQDSERQSLKRVGIPAIRGKILDHNGRVLADNKPQYNAVLYLEVLQRRFDEAYSRLTNAYARQHPEIAPPGHRLRLPAGESHALQLAADCQVVSNITYNVGARLQEQRLLNTNAFLRHYNSYPYVPFEIVPDLDPRQLAVFAEQLSGQPDLDIETEPVRSYPNGALAAHVLGFVQRDMDEDPPDYEGRAGLERVFDNTLRGRPGLKLVLVNNLSYRQHEDIDTPNAPGNDLYLTIDLPLQRAAEQALAEAQANVRGAAVVVDVRNGDILAMASAPAFDPNDYVTGLTHDEWVELNDPKYTPQINRAIDGAYPPGSTFKIITSFACLESGLNPEEVFDSPGYYQASPKARPIADTAGAGKFNFTRAFFRSSNTYFIHYGMMAGLHKILEVARRFHLGEKTDLNVGPEVAGTVPEPEDAGITLPLSSTADVCIGQEVTVTPLQMTMLIATVANGGKLFWPRLVSHSYSPDTGQDNELVAPGRLRDIVEMNPRHLEIIRQAMLLDTEQGATAESREGSAYVAFHHPNGDPWLPNFHVAGKTGTAQVKRPGVDYKVVWFDSYAPYENPRYAVVVMVEAGGSGGGTCAPVARKIYQAILKHEPTNSPPAASLARN